MKLNHHCLSIDWEAFDSNVLILQENNVVEHYLVETSRFQGSFGARETKIPKHAFENTTNKVSFSKE